jgi:hypothetical protein
MGQPQTVTQACSGTPPQTDGDALARTAGLDRLLSRWGRPPAAAQPLAERFGACLAWTDAVALAQALAPAPPSDRPRTLPGGTPWGDARAAVLRLHGELQAGLADPLLAREAATPLRPGALPVADLLAPYRLHLAQQQRVMAQRVAALRARLRAGLARSGSPRMARLAQLDAVFERALGARQTQALANLPGLLFGPRARAHQARDPAGWPARLWADLQQLLGAELVFHLQPVWGLIEAAESETDRARGAPATPGVDLTA